ncbi:MAG TPA: PF20097 family protein [Thermoplasmata archaeon]|nr:PF20097 family protein [Thermoplasmata archaeon]
MTDPEGPLPESPPTCRRCGKVMESGFVEGEGGISVPATILWVGSSDQEDEELAPLPFWRFSASPRFPAYRCEACGLLEVDYKREVSH